MSALVHVDPIAWLMRRMGMNARTARRPDFTTLIPPGPVAPPPPVPAFGPTDPLTLITTATPIFFLSGDLGVTLDVGASAWADQSGNGVNYSQATGTLQPTYSAADTDFGSRGSLTGDGAGDFLSTVLWDPPAPVTTNIWFFAVLRQVGWTAGRYLINGSAATTLSLVQSGVSPNMVQNNGASVNGNTGAATGTSVRAEVLFSNSVNDYIKMGPSSVSGGNALNNNSGALFSLFGRSNGTSTCSLKIACMGAWAGDPSSGNKSSVDSWVTGYYGVGVSV